MTEFRFNFSLESDDGGEVKSSGSAGSSYLVSSKRTQDTPAARQIPILPFHRQAILKLVPVTLSIPGSSSKLRYISGKQSSETVASINTQDGGEELKSFLELSDSQHSDLIPGVYEGGLKVWKCALDLVKYLSESGFDFAGKRVLELGCGAGLPGIYALMRGAKSVHFQDYNSEVLNYITIPNVLLNFDCVVEGTVCFFSGDWSTLPSVLPEGSIYDVILTSETIYCLESQPKLLVTLRDLCCPRTGLAYVAAKSFYFGVGGGVDSFCQLLDEDGTFQISRCREFDASVPRLILKLTHS